MNTLKQKILRKEKTIGTIISMAGACVSDILSRIGYDFLWIDCEHSYLSYEDVLTHVTIAKNSGTAVIVRVPQNDLTATKKILEMGVDGIIFPMVKSVEEAKALIDFTLYPPLGSRGFGPMSANHYGLKNANEYVEEANSNLCRFVQIENAEIVDQLEQLMENKYIDGYIFGPNDLSGSINDFLNVYGEKTTCLMNVAIEKLKHAGKYIGIATGSNKKEVVRHWSGMGADMVCAGGDYGFLVDGAVNLKTILSNEHKGEKND